MDIEDFIFLITPIFAAMITALMFALIFGRKVTRIDAGVAIMAGMVSFLFGPRCLCIGIHDTIIGALYFSGAFGVGVFLLFLAACFAWKQK